MLTLERFTGDLQTRARAWLSLSDEARRREALLAANSLDREALWGLTEAYLATYGEAGARVSKHTVSSYRTGLGVLLDYALERGVNLVRPSRDAGVSYARELEAEGKTTSTVKVRLAAARLLYRALRWAGATEIDPFTDVKPAKDTTAPWDKRSPYEQSEIAAMLSVCDDHPDKLLVLLAAHSGLRVSECTALMWEHVALESRRLTVAKGKGGKRRVVPISSSLLAALNEARQPPSQAVGARPSGPVLPFRTREAARQRLRRLCLKAGVVYRAVHSLRHACGTRLVADGRTLEDAARMLGHSSIETTRSYVHWANNELTKTVSDW